MGTANIGVINTQRFDVDMMLPYDAEVEYLESTGNQFIDTGAKALAVTGLDMTFTPLASMAPAYQGYLSTPSNTDFVIGRINTAGTGTCYFRFDASKTLFANTDVLSLENPNRMYIDQDRKWIVNGTDYGTVNADVLGTVDENMIFGGIRSNYARNGAIRLYCIKLYGLNGILIRDMIPVRFTNEQGFSEGAMYDRVSGQLFRNQGTDSFIVGPDVVEVEYLESTGTQWIGTGFIPDQDSQLELTFENTNTDTTVYNLWLAGAFIGSGNTNAFGVRITLGDSEVGCFAPSPARAFYYGPNIGVKLTAAFKDKTWSIANVTSGVAGDLECRAPLTLFAINWATTTSSYTASGLSIARIYGFKAWSNGTLVRDMIPVRVGMEGAMMDRLTRRIYRNQGTGAFSFGADKKETPLAANSYIKDGLVNLIDGIENGGFGIHHEGVSTTHPIVDCITGAQYSAANTYLTDIGFAQKSTYGFPYISCGVYGATEFTVEMTALFYGGQYPSFVRGNSGDKIYYPQMAMVRGSDIGSGAYVRGGAYDARVYQGSGAGASRLACHGFFRMSTATNDLGIGVNGAQMESKSTTVTNFVFPMPSSGIGFADYSSTDEDTGLLQSRLYAIRTYNRWLTDAELAHNYQIDIKRFSLPATS